MLLNALITGRPSRRSTQRLSGIPASISSMPAIPLPWVIVARIDHHHVARDPGKQIFRQIPDLRLGNRHHHHVAGAGRLPNRYRLRAALFRERGE